MDNNNLPEEIVGNREVIECNFVFSIYKELENISDYQRLDVNRDLMTEDGKYYWGLAKAMFANGYKSIDNMSIYSFLADKEKAKEQFETKGGWQTVSEIMSLINVDNTSAYYDELCKNNMLINLYKAGFNVMGDLEKYQKMSSEELYDFFDYQLQDIAIDKIEKINAEDMSINYDDYIDEWDKGTMLGFPIGTPMLNYQLAGIHKKNLMLHLGGIGQGKTTTAVIMYVIPAIQNGENVLIIANEQTASEFRQIILATVLFNKIKGVKGMNRQKFIKGSFTDEQKLKLKEAAKWVENQEGNITFVEMQDYNITNVRKVIKKYSKIGYGLVVYDTLKPMSDASERSWGEFSDVAKELFLLSKKCDVAIVATAQMTSDANQRTILDLSCVGKSRSIAETSSTVLGFRPVRAEEIQKLKPYNFEKNDDGVSKKVVVTLQEDKHYVIWFIMKNRFGATSPHVVMEFDQSFCKLREIGYVNL